MKKVSIFAMAAVVAASSMVSCNGIADSGKVANSADTLSMKMGEMYGYGLSEQFTKRDSAFDKDEFVRGFEMGLKEQNNVDLNTYIFASEFKKAFTSDSAVNPMLLQGEVNMLMQKEMRAAKERNPKAIANREAGKKFIEDLVKNDTAVKVTESGLAYKVVKPGKGAQFKTTDRIMVKYKGTKIDGSVFDESKEARVMSPVSVVPGFKEGLLMMSPGASYVLYVPGELAYGVDGRGAKIEPNETLIFEVETVGLEQKKK